MMKIKEKSWIWRLTGPFASSNYTTIGDTIYYPKGCPPCPGIIKHESVHMKQIEQYGIWFYFLYLFCCPLFWNPWRKKWELEAYRTQYASDEPILRKLRNAMYGWLL